MSLPTNPTVRIDASRVVQVVDATGWEPSAWDDLAVRSPTGEAFQSHAWGELKRSLGWTPLRYVLLLKAAPIAVVSIQERALLGRRGGPLGRYRIHYAPRGPVLLSTGPEAAAAALGRTSAHRTGHAILSRFTIDPAWEEGSGRAAALRRAGFRLAARDVQVSRTAMIVPLRPSEGAQRDLLGAHHLGRHQSGHISRCVTTERDRSDRRSLAGTGARGVLRHPRHDGEARALHRPRP